MAVVDEGEHVFVVGSARSGTSMLSNVLRNSPMFASYYAEAKLLDGCRQKYGSFERGRSRKAFFKDWLQSRQYKRSGLSKEEASDVLETSDSYASFLSAYMNRVANKQGCNRWIDSTPDNSFYLETIAAAYPNAKVIHMLRDGRAVALSLAMLGWSGVGTRDHDKSILYSALKWQESILKARSSSDVLKNRYLEVRYEDFVYHPEKKISEICNFLDIPEVDDTAMNADASDNLYSTLHTPNTPFADLSKGISTGAVDRWKKLLTDDQKRLLEVYIGATLVDLGYSLVSENQFVYGEIITREMRKFYLRSRRFLKDNTIMGRFTVSPLEIGMD